jgi:hypothetical protein
MFPIEIFYYIRSSRPGMKQSRFSAWPADTLVLLSPMCSAVFRAEPAAEPVDTASTAERRPNRTCHKPCPEADGLLRIPHKSDLMAQSRLHRLTVGTLGGTWVDSFSACWTSTFEPERRKASPKGPKRIPEP